MLEQVLVATADQAGPICQMLTIIGALEFLAPKCAGCPLLPLLGNCGVVGGPRAMPAAAATQERRLGQLAAASGVLRVTRTPTAS